MMSLTSIIGPLLMTNLFYFFTRPGTPVHFSGAPFLMGSILLLISAILAYGVLKQEKQLAVSN
jgi:DHA1 family tetracycline resistance protein-like MFS transporter